MSLLVAFKPIASYSYSKNADWLHVLIEAHILDPGEMDLNRILWIQQLHMLILSPLTPYLLHCAAQRHACCFTQWQKLGSWILTTLIVKSQQWGRFLRIWGLLTSWGDFPIAQTHTHTHTHTHIHTDTHTYEEKVLGELGELAISWLCACVRVCVVESLRWASRSFPHPLSLFRMCHKSQH